MGKIFYIMGKSASGKDTIYKSLLHHSELHLYPVTLYTTRPRRSYEKNGEDYFFISEQEADRLVKEGKVIEKREYQTVHGNWRYMTVNDGQWSEDKNFLLIGTLESYVSMSVYFGKERLVPLYIEVEDGERLSRAIQREKAQDQPKYLEMCRRFLADAIDFSPEKKKEAGINRTFLNHDQESCIRHLISYVKENISEEEKNGI